MDFRQIFRTSKKDEQITELESQVERLTEQNTKLSQEAERREQAMEALTGEHGKLLAQSQLVEEQLEMARVVEVNQAEVIAVFKQSLTQLETELADHDRTHAARDERIRELEHDAAEYAVASERYVKDITDLQGECMRFMLERSVLPNDVLIFMRKCATGANIRADKPGGAKLVEQAKWMLEQYDSTGKEQAE